MKTKHTNKVVSVVLVLSMLLGMFTVLSVGASAEGTTTPTIDTVTEWKFADNYYRSDWTKSTVNVEEGQLYKADGTKDAFSWNPNVGATVEMSEDGTLSITRGSGGSYEAKMTPSKMSTDTLGVGPAYLAFDWYIDPSSGAYLYHNIAGTCMFFVQINWSIYYYQKWGTNLNSMLGLSDTQTPGWDRVEIVFVPQTATGEICTSPDQVVATNTLYMRARNISKDEPLPSNAPSGLDLSTFAKIADITDAKWVGHYSQLSELSNSQFSLDKTGSTLQMRNFVSGNLLPSTGETAGTDSSISTVRGYGIKESHYESNWTAADDSSWFGYLKGDPATGQSANIYWQKGEYGIEAGGATIDENGAFTVDAATADNNIYDTSSILMFRPGHGGTGVAEGPVRVKFNYMWYGAESENSASGFRFRFCDYDLFYVNAAGKVTNLYGSHIDLGQMTDAGWYTFEVLMLPKDAEGNICFAADATIAHTDLYYKISKGDGKDKIDTCGYDTLAHNDLLTQGYTYKKADNMKKFYSKDKTYIVPVAKSGCFTIANLYTANILDDSELYTVKVNDGTGEKTYYVPNNYTAGALTLPAVAGVDAWMVEGTTKGSLSITEPGTETTILDNSYIRGGMYDDTARIGGVTMSLGTTMSLNMKVKASVLAGAPEEILVGVNGSSVFGSTDTPATESILTSTGYEDFYSVSVSGIRAADIGRDLHFHLVAKVDGKYYIAREATVYSVMRYVTRTYGREGVSDEVNTLLTALVNYGATAEAQRYGTTVLSEAAKAVGITTVPTLPTDNTAYTSTAMTETDIATFNSYVMTGATLTNGIDMVLVPNTEGVIKGVRVTIGDTAKEYFIGSDGKITIQNLAAATLLNTYQVTFIGADGADLESASFVIGNFLELRRTDERASAGEKALAEATILYMMAVRKYALNAN